MALKGRQISCWPPWEVQVQLHCSAAASGNAESAAAAEAAIRALSASALASSALATSAGSAAAVLCGAGDAAVAAPRTRMIPATETSDGSDAGLQRVASSLPGLRQRSSALNPATDSWEKRSSSLAPQDGGRQGLAPGFE